MTRTDPRVDPAGATQILSSTSQEIRREPLRKPLAGKNAAAARTFRLDAKRPHVDRETPAADDQRLHGVAAARWPLSSGICGRLRSARTGRVRREYRVGGRTAIYRARSRGRVQHV